jgi:hypothetical protein
LVNKPNVKVIIDKGKEKKQPNKKIVGAGEEQKDGITDISL